MGEKQQPLVVRVYYDYKSPFSYLAKDGIYQILADYNVVIKWLPFQFSVAELFQLPAQRTALGWKKVKYLYLDARRFANERGIKIFGPTKAFDSTLALGGGLYALEQNDDAKFRAYHDRVFKEFFLRKLDIEDPDKIVQALNDAQIKVTKTQFLEFMEQKGKPQLEEIKKMADGDGVWGVPSVVVEGELFFGNDRLDWVRKKLDKLGAKRMVAAKL